MKFDEIYKKHSSSNSSELLEFDEENITRDELIDVLEDFEQEFMANNEELAVLMTHALLEVVEEMPEDQVNMIGEKIYDIFDGEDDDNGMEEEIDEDQIDEFVAKKKKRDKIQRLQARRTYRKTKSKIKLKSARFRKTSGYKRYSRKKKRLGLRGKTSTGKRITKFIK